MLPADRVTPKEAARLLDVKPTTIYRYVRNGTLHAYRVAGSRYKLSRAEVLRLVEEVQPVERIRTRQQEIEAAEAASARFKAKGYK